MTKPLTLILIFTCLGFQSLSSQSSLNVGLKTGLQMGYLDVESQDIFARNVESYRRTPNYYFAVSPSWLVKPKFRLGAELANTTFYHYFIYDLTGQDGIALRYNGRYRISQFNLSIVPEYRPVDWGYLNAGLGLSIDYRSHFTDGTRGNAQVPAENITGTEFKRSLPMSAFIGIGLCPNITDELAVLAEMRFNASPGAINSANDIGVGYYALNINIGLMYKLRN